MQASQDVDLLDFQALDSRICRMGVQRHLGLRQPLTERFGIDGEQVTTLDERKTGHETDSFLRNCDDALREIEGEVQGISLEFPWSVKECVKDFCVAAPTRRYPAAQRCF